MDNETPVAAGERSGSRHVSRRTVVRAGLHAAWVVPTVQFVSAAPAFAAASDTLQITAASGDWTLNGGLLGSDYMEASITVANNSPNDPTAALQLTLSFPYPYVYGPWFFDPTGASANRSLFTTQVVSGWSASAVSYSGSGTGRTGTVIFTRSTQIPAGGSASLTFRASTSADVSNGTAGGSADTVSIQATATGFVPGAGAFNPVP